MTFARSRADARRLLLALPVSRTTAGAVLRHIRACNPTLSLDLALYTGGDRPPPRIDAAATEGFGHVVRLESWMDLEGLVPCAAVRRCMEELFSLQDRYSLFRNTLLLYALIRGYDHVVFWDDDEYPIPDPDAESFFDPYLRAMAGGADVVIGHRYGYVNPVSSGATSNLDPASLRELERALLCCNEVAYPGFLTGSRSNFVRARPRGPAGPVTARPKWVRGGNLALRLHRTLPPFFQPRGARGEDTFFSLQLNDYEVVRVSAGIFHDPFAELEPTPGATDWEALAPSDDGDVADASDRFWTAVRGWIGYGPLKERIQSPDDWRCKRDRIREHLARVRGCPFDLVAQYERRLSALEADERDYRRVRALWAELNDVHLPVLRGRRQLSAATRPAGSSAPRLEIKDA